MLTSGWLLLRAGKRETSAGIGAGKFQRTPPSEYGEQHDLQRWAPTALSELAWSDISGGSSVPAGRYSMAHCAICAGTMVPLNSAIGLKRVATAPLSSRIASARQGVRKRAGALAYGGTSMFRDCHYRTVGHVGFERYALEELRGLGPIGPEPWHLGARPTRRTLRAPRL